MLVTSPAPGWQTEGSLGPITWLPCSFSAGCLAPSSGHHPSLPVGTLEEPTSHPLSWAGLGVTNPEWDWC